MSAGSSGRSTAGSTRRTRASLDSSNSSLGIHSNVGSIDQKAVSAIRNVSTHGSERGLPSVGETSQTSHAEMFTVVVKTEGLFQGTGQLIAAQRGCDKGVGLSESSSGELFSYLSKQLTVGQRLGEDLGDLGLKILKKRRIAKNKTNNKWTHHKCKNFIISIINANQEHRFMSGHLQ